MKERKKNKKYQQDTFMITCKNIMSGVVSFFVLLILTIFPLFYRNYYYDILESKYYFYAGSVLTMIAVVVLLALAFLIVDFLENKGRHVKLFFGKFSIKNLKNTIGLWDCFLFLFLVFIVVATLGSDYVYESFWGNEGRYTGAFLHLLYVISFWIVSRLYLPKKWHVYAFLAVAMLPLLFGITDYFRMDILHFKRRIAASDADRFVSTFGNINTYTTYVGMVLGLVSVLFVTEKNKIGTALSYAALVITLFALIVGGSDNSYLALGIVFGFLPLVAFGTRTGVKRYVLMGASFLTVAQVIHLVAKKMGDEVIDITGLFGVLTDSKYIIFAVIVSWIGTFLLYFFSYKLKSDKDKEELGWSLRRIWLIFIGVAALTVTYVLFDANQPQNAQKYGALSNYLVFDDDWGTHRGYIWRIAMESYERLPKMQKIFGYGLDIFAVLVEPYRGESHALYGEFFDSAHNEYLQYFLSIGPMGLLSYLGFLVCCVVGMIRSKLDKPIVYGLMFAVLCYLTQAMVTINLPIATPVFWMLLSVGMAWVQREKRKLVL